MEIKETLVLTGNQATMANRERQVIEETPVRLVLKVILVLRVKQVPKEGKVYKEVTA